MNLLVSAIGGDVACATLRSIRGAYHCDKIVGFDVRENIQGRMYVDKFLLAPRYTNETEYKAFLDRVIMEEGISCFWPMTEYEIKWTDVNRDFFERRGIKLLINNSKIIDIAGSKAKTAIFLKENGFDVPDTICINEECTKKDVFEKIGFPLIIKMDDGCGSKNLKIVKTSEEWANINLQEYVGYVAQQYVGDVENEYTVGVFSDGENINSVIFRRKLGLGGMSVEVETVRDDSVTVMIKKLSKLLELKGAINVQLRKVEDKNYIFEINPRISSTVGFRDLLGFKDAVWWLQFINGENIDMDIEVPANIVGIKTLDEMILEDK